MPRMQPTLQNAPVDKNTPEGQNWLRLRRLWEQLARVINGQLSFGDGVNGDNIDGKWFTVVSPGVANTDFTITHNLQRDAVGYIIMAKDGACDVYTSPTVNTDPTHKIILRATTTGVTLTLFIV